MQEDSSIAGTHPGEQRRDDAIASEICAFLDFEFFQHDSNGAHIREMGWISHSALQPINVQVRPANLSLDDTKARHTFSYQKWRIHGLSFFPDAGAIAFPETKVHLLVSFLYLQAQTRERFRVAYKGGTVERSLLEKLAIPSLNLEDLTGGCPKRSDGENILKVYECGFHSHCRDGYRHCASAEVVFYRNWLLKREEEGE